MASRSERTKKLVLSALICALTFIGTYLCIPVGSAGYLNFGDGVLLAGAWILGIPWGLSAALGASLCDLALGYVVYAPATLIIKLLMVLSAALLRRALKKTSLPKQIPNLVSGIVAELLMTAGYYLYESVLLGSVGSFSAALVNIPFNLIQGVFALLVAALASVLFSKRGGA